MTEPTRHRLHSSGVELSVLTLGAPQSNPVVVLHGMRDVSLSLLPLAAALADSRHVILPDLRGHGRSGKPGSYAMPEFVFDLMSVIRALSPERPVALFGHSLGGHIVTRFSALFPDLVRAVVVVEGLGPPARPWLDDPEARLRSEAQRLLGTYDNARQRPLPSVEFAAERLLVNNPRLDPGYALTLARQATERNADDNLVWAFDPHVGSVFLSAGEEGSQRYWSGVRCPTLLVTGGRSSEYWSHAMPPGEAWDGSFAPGELEGRLACFADHEHVEFPDAGHMVHFDEPERLADTTLDFLRRRA